MGKNESGRVFAAFLLFLMKLDVAGESGALVRSKDSGKTWIDRVPTGPFDTHQMASHLSAPGRFYSAAGDGYFESTDGGETWQRLEVSWPEGFNAGESRALALSIDTPP